MDVTGVIEAFQRLQSTDSRRAALLQLVTELTPYEWRQLNAITSSRKFTFDIVGNLPLELVVNIFAHLEPSTPYRLRRVSTRWNYVLQSLDILQASLDHWYEGFVDLATVDHAFCKSKAQSVHALRTGKPRDCVKLSLEQPMQTPFIVGDTLLWQPRQYDQQHSRLVYLLDLDTWNLRTFSGEGREEIICFCVSDELVAVNTFSGIYVSTIDVLAPKKFRLPNHSFKTITCRKRTVACSATFVKHFEIYIWNYDSQVGKSFRVKRHPAHLFFKSELHCTHYHRVHLLLQPDTGTIMIFGDVRCSKRLQPSYLCSSMPGPIIFSRFTYDGKCISSSYMPPLVAMDSFRFTGIPDEFVPVNRTGMFAVRLNALYEGVQQALFFQYDERLDKFTMIHASDSEGGLWTDSCTGWWKDAFYRIDAPGASLAHLDSGDGSRLRPLVSLLNEAGIPGSDNPVIMNEKHVVFHGLNSAYVLRFEESKKQPKKTGPISGVEMVEILNRGE